jgi:hypothetical protein
MKLDHPKLMAHMCKMARLIKRAETTPPAAAPPAAAKPANTMATGISDALIGATVGGGGAALINILKGRDDRVLRDSLVAGLGGAGAGWGIGHMARGYNAAKETDQKLTFGDYLGRVLNGDTPTASGATAKDIERISRDANYDPGQVGALPGIIDRVSPNTPAKATAGTLAAIAGFFRGGRTPVPMVRRVGRAGIYGLAASALAGTVDNLAGGAVSNYLRSQK